MISLGGFKLPIQRVTLTDEDVPPLVCFLEIHFASRRERLRVELRRVGLEVLLHGIEDGLAGEDHVVSDVTFLVERIALG